MRRKKDEEREAQEQLMVSDSIVSMLFEIMKYLFLY